MNWQPIETAPKDGTPVLLFADGHVSVGTNDAGDELWFTLAGGKQANEIFTGYDAPEYGPILVTPTHWMPLPEPPQT